MDFYRTREGDVRPRVSGPRFRPAWSLAAGWAATPRIGRFAAVVAVAALIERYRWVEPSEDGSFLYVHEPARGAFLAALMVWAVWTSICPALRRRVGERRRRRRGGDAWWRDDEWPTDRAERRISTGLRGLTTMFVVSVAVLGLLCVGGWWYLDSHANMWGDPYLFGLIYDAPAAFVVATYALPLTWLLVVLARRLGRGRLLVSWPTFPQFTGTRCAFHVGTSPGGAQIDGVRVFLRCIRVRHRPLLPLATWNARLVWVAEARLPLGTHVGPESHVRAEFYVPTDAPSTDLHAADAVRWELLVLGTVAAADYADAVVVPVYAPESGNEASGR